MLTDGTLVNVSGLCPCMTLCEVYLYCAVNWYKNRKGVSRKKMITLSGALSCYFTTENLSSKTQQRQVQVRCEVKLCSILRNISFSFLLSVENKQLRLQ